MAKKSTDELEHILGQTSTTNIEEYLAENAESLLAETKPFSAFIFIFSLDSGLFDI